MYTKEERENLNIIAMDLAYSSIRFTRLHLELENEEWEALSKELAGKAQEVINSRIQERIEQMEAQKEAV